MARDYSGTAQYHAHAAALVSGPPFTMAAWFQSDSITANQIIMSVLDADSTDGWSMRAGGAVAGDPVQALSTAAGTAVVANSSAGYTATGWYLACAVFTSATSRAAYLNGANKGTNATSNTPGDARTTTRIASNAAGGALLDGRAAEAAIWDIALSDADVAALGMGYTPDQVRPDALVAYWPLMGRSAPEPDFVGRFDMTATGTPAQFGHPRIIQARRPQLVLVPAAAGQPTMRRWGGSIWPTGAQRIGRGW